MSQRRRLGQHRDVALTTLIDLLVQVIFVLALILVSADVMGTESRERGWVTPEAWKTLVSISDVDPHTLRDAPTHVAASTSTDNGLKDERPAYDRQAGRGPGHPTCRTAAGAEMVVAEATIERDGRIVVTPGRDAGALQDEHSLAAEAFGVPLAAERFGAVFRRWREQGLTRQPPCAFKADVRYDARAAAGDYEPARRAIASYFTLSAPPRRF